MRVGNWIVLVNLFKVFVIIVFFIVNLLFLSGNEKNESNVLSFKMEFFVRVVIFIYMFDVYIYVCEVYVNCM